MWQRKIGPCWDELFIAMIPPCRGYGIVAKMKLLPLECGIDESATTDDEQALCLAAYVFRPEALNGFNRHWDKILGNNNLAKFHMADCMCMKPREPNEFDGWSIGRRTRLVKSLVKVIRANALFGLALTVDRQAFTTNPVLKRWDGAVKGIYPFALVLACSQISTIRRSYKDLRDRQVSYYIERGHSEEKSAEEIMGAIGRDERLKEEHAYFHHEFVPKGAMRTNEAADMMAWIWRKKGRGEMAANRTNEVPARSLALDLTRSRYFGIRHYRLHMGPERITRRALQIASSGWGKYLRKEWGAAGRT